MSLNTPTTVVIDLGYVDLSLAVKFGNKRPVIGFDIKVDRIALHNRKALETKGFEASRF